MALSSSNGFVDSTARSIQVFGPAVSTDVVEARAFSLPDLIFCEFIIPLDYWNLDEGGTAFTNLIDAGLETIGLAVAHHQVQDARFEQEIRQSGLILNFIVFTVAVPSGSPFGGDLTGEYRVNVDWMTDRGLRAGLVFDPLDALAASLANQTAFTPPTGPGGTVTTTTTTPPGGMPHL